jgi:hypothetical protein
MRYAVWLSVLVALLVASPALAQTGQINGMITDNTGAVLPGATVKAVEVATGLSRETVTGADGRFTFTALRPTTYDLTAELTGFRTATRKGVLLQANENLTVNFGIEIGALAETVTVSGESPVVDVTSAALNEVVDSKRIVELPLQGRDAREAEHPRRRHGADGGRSESAKRFRARCGSPPTAPRRGRCRSASRRQATPIRTSSRTSRSRSPTRSRNSASRRATTARRRATAPARW